MIIWNALNLMSVGAETSIAQILTTKFNSCITLVAIKANTVKNIRSLEKMLLIPTTTQLSNLFALTANFVHSLMTKLKFHFNSSTKWKKTWNFIYILLKLFGVLLSLIIIVGNASMLTTYKTIEEIRKSIIMNQFSAHFGKKMTISKA